MYISSAMITVLPWIKLLHGVKSDLKEVELMKLLQVKQINPHLPKEFQIILNHARALKFGDRPDYDSLRGLLQNIKAKLENSSPYWDWQIKARSKV